MNDRIGSVQSLVETMNRNRGMIENGDPKYMNRLPSSQQPTGDQALIQGTRDLILRNEISSMGLASFARKFLAEIFYPPRS